MGSKCEYSLEWPDLLGVFAFNYRIDGEKTYSELVELIRNVCDGSFDITDCARCRRYKHSMAILQVKPLPWEYLFECMKRSQKDFYIILPDTALNGIPSKLKWHNSRVNAWYNEDKDAIECVAYTGNTIIEEDTSPGYDGYGRYDTIYEIINGTIGKDGQWLELPWISFGG